MWAAGGNRLSGQRQGQTRKSYMFPETVHPESQGLWLPGHGPENGPLHLTEGKDTLLLKDVCRPKAYSFEVERESSHAPHPELQ